MPTYSDISLTFKKHPFTNDIVKKNDVDAVKQSMKTILVSSPYDIPFNPNYGGGLRQMMFELIDPSLKALAKRKIILLLNEYEPRAVIEDIYLDDSQENGINFGILFYVKGSEQAQTLNFVLERVR